MFKYNEAKEVSKKFYDFVASKLSALVAYRTENGRYFVKPLTTKFLPDINNLYLKSLKNV